MNSLTGEWSRPAPLVPGIMSQRPAAHSRTLEGAAERQVHEGFRVRAGSYKMWCRSDSSCLSHKQVRGMVFLLTGRRTWARA